MCPLHFPVWPHILLGVISSFPYHMLIVDSYISPPVADMLGGWYMSMSSLRNVTWRSMRLFIDLGMDGYRPQIYPAGILSPV